MYIIQAFINRVQIFALKFYNFMYVCMYVSFVYITMYLSMYACKRKTTEKKFHENFKDYTYG